MYRITIDNYNPDDSRHGNGRKYNCVLYDTHHLDDDVKWKSFPNSVIHGNRKYYIRTSHD